jgi:hypothetical protein
MVTPLSRSLRDGMAAALARDFEAAHALLQQATTESPADIGAWLWRAVASPSPAAAMSCIRRVLVFEPSHVQAQQRSRGCSSRRRPPPPATDSRRRR